MKQIKRNQLVPKIEKLQLHYNFSEYSVAVMVCVLLHVNIIKNPLVGRFPRMLVDYLSTILAKDGQMVYAFEPSSLLCPDLKLMFRNT